MPRKKSVLMEEQSPDLNQEASIVVPVNTTNSPSSALPLARARIEVAKSGTLNTIITIMVNGSRHPLFGKTTHPGLIQLLFNAYNRDDPDKFLDSIKRYLEQAIGNVPQAGKREEIEPHMQEVTRLVEQAGVQEVGRRIIPAIMSANLL